MIRHKLFSFLIYFVTNISRSQLKITNFIIPTATVNEKRFLSIVNNIIVNNLMDFNIIPELKIFEQTVKIKQKEWRDYLFWDLTNFFFRFSYEVFCRKSDELVRQDR